MKVNKNTCKSVEWYTPAWIFEVLKVDFDLDPSSPHDMETSVPARTKYTIFDNGLAKPWFGKVWLNPPYGRETTIWMDRMIDHGNGVGLVFAKTDAKWCQKLMHSCGAIIFLSGRIQFVPGYENQHKRSRSGAASLMFAFGDECVTALKRMGDRGFYLENNNSNRK